MQPFIPQGHNPAGDKQHSHSRPRNKKATYTLYAWRSSALGTHYYKKNNKPVNEQLNIKAL